MTRHLQKELKFLRATMTLALLMLTIMTAWADGPITGNCGASVTYSFDGKTLTISGTGAMVNYSSSDDQPWKGFRNVIESLVIKKDVTSIGSYAFADCENLGAVKYEAGTQLTTIGNYAFYGCSWLASAYIPSSVESIGDYAFANGGNGTLKNVFVCPETPPALGSNVFAGDSYYKYFTVRSDAYQSWSSLGTLIVGDAANFDIPYIDADGNKFICPYATPISSSNYYFDYNGDLWYYVSGNVDGVSNLSFPQEESFGTANIILRNNATLTVGSISSSANLSIYGQKNDEDKITGSITIENGSGSGIYAGKSITINGVTIGISGSSYEYGINSYEDITINGGNITFTGATDNGISASSGGITITDSKISFTGVGGISASEGYFGGGDITITNSNIKITGGGISASKGDYDFCKGGNITINGSEITVDGGKFWSEGGNITINDGTITVENDYDVFVSSGSITINGGTVTATSTYAAGLSGNTITLGDATITASSYQVGSSIKIADGLTLSDGTDAYSGTLYDSSNSSNGKFGDLAALNAALANKTLKKLPAFIDLTARIVWNDNNDQYKKRPTSVTVSLKGNGTQIATCELTESGEWKYTVNKPSLSNGTLIVYTWDVPDMPNGYGLTGNSADGTTTTLTLTLQQCGENVAWNYDASSMTLTISGTGAMADYSSTDVKPWSSFSNEIESLVINKDVTSIGSYAFTECTKLESVTYEAESQLEAIGGSAFAGCRSLASIIIPAGVTSIGASAFADCENLGSVTYAAGTQLTTIGENAFAACSSLASIIIPVGVSSIGASAFDGCTSLISVTAYPQTPPTLGVDAFKEINENVAFTVRNDSYETADGWIDWASKMTILDPSQFISYIDADGNEAFCTNATKITSECISYGGTDEEDDLWYYVDGTVETSNYLNFQDFSGSTNIILCDGASLKVKYLEANNAIKIYRQGGNTPGKITTTGSNNGEYGLSAGNGDLSIYGGTIEISGSKEGMFSSGGNITIADCNITISDEGGFTAWANYWGGGDIIINSGNITITDGDIYATKGENDSGKGGNITINGGEITVNKGKFWSFGGDILINDGTITVEGYSGFESDGSVTINGGKITATPTGDNSYGISAGGSVTINGGEIIATATGSGSRGIFAGSNITLGDATITASSYQVDQSSGSIKITDGLFMSEGSKAYSGTLYDGNNTSNGKFEDLETLNTALAGKTLQQVPDKIDLTARIIWNDNNNQYNKRPESVTVKLMADGVEVEGTTCPLAEDENGEWNCTVTNQPSLNEGELIDYSWEVNDVSGWYELSESAEATTTTFTFTIQQCGQEGSDVIWCYDPSTKELTVSGTGFMMYYNSIQNENGWSNGAPWKDFADEIETVVIENGITYVGSNTFAHCPKISSVTLPANEIYEIGSGTFADCTSLTCIDIPMSINKIGDQAFAGCSSLATVTIGYGEASSFTIGTEVFPATAVIIVPEAGLSGYQSATGWSTYQIAPATRTLFATNSSNQWMTWCDKNAFMKPEGVTVYTVSGVDDNTVLTSEVSGDVIPAYTPVLLYRTEAGADAVKATFNAVGTASDNYNATTGLVTKAETGFSMLGNATDATITEGGFTEQPFYSLYNGKFYRYEGTQAIAAHRCILTVSPVYTAPVLNISEEITSLTPIPSPKGEGREYFYTLDGRKLDKQPTKKGIYINGGRKVVIK